MTTIRRHASLDGLRGLAALGVCFLHVATSSGLIFEGGVAAWLTARLSIGVPLFFALSGLLLYRPWVRHALADGPAPRTVRYLVRRVLRVVPAYWLCVIGILLLWGASRFDLRLLVMTGIGQIPATYHLWTLPVELGFYLGLPLWARVTGRWARRGPHPARRLLYGCALLATVSLATAPFPDLGYWLPHHLIYFAAGMALCVLSVAAPDRLREACTALRAHLLVAAALLYALLATPLAGPAFVAPPAGPYESLAKMVLEAGVVLLLLAAVGFGPQGRFLGSRTAAAFGRISYGFYLWHAPVIAYIMAATGSRFGDAPLLPLLAVTLVATTALAAVSYVMLERPFTR